MTAHIYYFSKTEEQGNKKVLPTEDIIKNTTFPVDFTYCQVGSPYELQRQINNIGHAVRQIKIVVDYLSFSNDKQFSHLYKNILCNSIISFPDYDFYFDATVCRKNEKTYLEFLFDIDIQISQKVDFESHCINFNERSKVLPYHQIIKGKDNIFDASNLRWAVIETLYKNKKQTGRNYEKSRSVKTEHYACSVHSERESSLILGYALYANGYRVSPISSKFEAERTKSMSPELIIRDCNLFFKDEDRCHGPVSDFDIKNKASISKDKKIEFDAHWGEETKYYFLSCGKPDSPLYINKIQKLSSTKIPGTDQSTIDGIYSQLMKIGEMPKSIDDSNPILHRDESEISHAIDTYEIVRAMVDRAFEYYNNQSYVLSAVVARTAIEINNCYFTFLWEKAFYILSLSENAISVDNRLGKDSLIADDAEERIKRIKKEAKRIVGDNATNLINQILSDCRLFCKNKERFLAEDVFISEMAHINEGFSLKKSTMKLFKR